MDHLKEAIQMLDQIEVTWFRKLLAATNEEADAIITYLLQDFNIRPLVIGGLAVQRYGYQRFTKDIDLLLSQKDFATLSAAGKIQGRNLLIRPDLKVEVLIAGEFNIPDPETIRDGDSFYPTLSQQESARHG